MKRYDGTICIRQRVLPTYRVSFFNALGDLCTELVVIAGQKCHHESYEVATELSNARLETIQNIYIARDRIVLQPTLRSKIAEIHPSAFITEAGTRFFDYRMLRRTRALRGKPIIGWGIGTTNFFSRRVTTLRRWRQLSVVNALDGMICYSSVAKTQYGERGMPDKRMFVAYNATAHPPEQSAPIPPRRKQCTVVTIGRLIESKRLDLLIEAMGHVKSQRSDVDLWVIGDGEYRNRLVGLARQHSVSTKFHGDLYGAELRETASKCHLFVLPSLGGLAIQQAMSFGLPVIVTEADGTERDLVRENGWIVKPGDSRALADAILHAVSDPLRLAAMAKVSLRIVREEINVRRMAETFVSAVLSMEEQGRR